MKKVILTAALAIVASLSSFAQGNIIFSGSIHEVGNDTNGTYSASWTTAGNFDVALLFSSSASTALTALSSAPYGGSATNGATYSTSGAWAAVASDLGGTWFQVDGSNSPAGPLVATGGSSGTWAYNQSTFFSAANVTAGTTYSAYELAWNTQGGTLTTLAQAEAAGASIGWSTVFSYTPTSGATTPTTINAGLASYYGVGGISAVPEPMTAALAGLGGLALLGLRRKK